MEWLKLTTNNELIEWALFFKCQVYRFFSDTATNMAYVEKNRGTFVAPKNHSTSVMNVPKNAK